MQSPPPLSKGQTVAIVAPAGKVDPALLQPLLAKLQAWGLHVIVGQHVTSVHHNFAGTDAQRTADLQAMLDDERIHAIICARGGYGTLRIIDQLNFDKFSAQPKWIVGFSDITVLHAHVNQVHRTQSIHATMAAGFANDPDGVESLRKILFGESLHYQEPANASNRNGNAQGKLLGGNLSMLNNITGSISTPTLEGNILFIEDLNEHLYHLDRMLLHLKRAGSLSQLAGLVVGGFTEMKDNAIPFGQTVEAIILQHVQAYNYPVAFQFPAGHLDRNLALPLGRMATLQVQPQQVSLTFANQ